MSLNILGAAALHPTFVIDQKDSAEYAYPLSCQTEKQQRALAALYARTRIRRRATVLLKETGGNQVYTFYSKPNSTEDPGPSTGRRMAKYEKFAGELATEVSRGALDRAGMTAREVTHLITVTCTGFYAPGFDYQLFRGLGLPETVERTQIGFMGCQAVLNALRIASALAAKDAKARVLICSVELCSLHFQYGWHPDRVVSNALFSDGAGAIVGSADHGLNQNKLAWKVEGTGSKLLPDSNDAMTWRIGDHGFLMTLSARIPEMIQRLLPGWIDEWLGEYGLSKSQVASWAIHPGGPRILTAAEKALDLTSARTAVSREVLTHYGNMSSATIIYILEHLIAEDAPRPCVALGFGPGLSVEGVLFN